MAVDTTASTDDLFELRSTTLTLLSVLLKTTDLARLRHELERRSRDNPGLFDNDPMAIDLTAVRNDAAALDFEALVALLREHRMMPIAAKGGTPAQMAAALLAGLADAPEAGPARPAPAAPAPTSPSAPTESPDASPPPRSIDTTVIDRPLRSGQQVYARGDLIVLAAVNFGAEVIADGHIHVYAPLRGRALAGARGNTAARIFSTGLEPQLVSIAGIYRTAEVPLPPDVRGKAAQVRLDGEKLVIDALRA